MPVCGKKKKKKKPMCGLHPSPIKSESLGVGDLYFVKLSREFSHAARVESH